MQSNIGHTSASMLSPTFDAVFYRTYSRIKDNGKKETWYEVCERTLKGIAKLGKLTLEEISLLEEMQTKMITFPSGRWLWIGGTPWIDNPSNFGGAYNCTSTVIDSWVSFGLLMDLSMMGCGTGAVLEPKYINKLPAIANKLDLSVIGEFGAAISTDETSFNRYDLDDGCPCLNIQVGDSRKGWVKAYQSLMEIASADNLGGYINVVVDVSAVRPSGKPLKGFGGISNPVKLKDMFVKVAAILNGAIGRKLNTLECCLLIDEAALAVVAGNIRRSAGIRQGIKGDETFTDSKMNLWQQDGQGNWKIDPKRDALRMANHTLLFHQKPTLQECIEAVDKQFHSGEGAIQWTGEAVYRCNADLHHLIGKYAFIKMYEEGELGKWMISLGMNEEEVNHRTKTYGLNPCGI